MSVSTGISFTLSDALLEANKLDTHFNKWVKQSIDINESMRKAFDVKGGGNIGQYIQGLKDMQTLIGEIGAGGLSIDTDSTKLEQLSNALDRVAKQVDALSSSGARIFDTKGLYADRDDILGLENDLSSTYALMNSLREKWREVEKAVHEDGTPYTQSEIDKARGDYENLMTKLIEVEAEEKKSLKFAKMTQDEKAQYIRKKTEEIFKAEEQYRNKTRADYKKLWDELKVYSSSRAAIDKASEGRTMTPEQQQTYDDLVAQEERIEAQIQKMYSEHQDILSDISAREMAKRAKHIAEELKNQTYDATTALGLAASARTGDQMERAKEAIKSALMTVDKDDLDAIDELNKAYLNLRASIEKLTKAQKNEQTLQPSIRNEYRRILKELDDLHAAQERLRNTDAYKGFLSTQEAQEAADAMAAFDAREKDLLDKKVKYEQEAGNLLDEVVRENAKRQADIRLQEFEKAQKELEAREKKYGSITSFEADQVIWGNSHADNVRKSQKAIEELTEARDKLNKYDGNYEKTLESLNKEIQKHEEFIESVTKAEEYREKQQKKQRETYTGAMDYSKQAKSINDLQKALKYLEEARRKEDLSTTEGKKRYQELTNELKRQQKNYDALTGSVKRSGHNLLNIGDQLARKLALVFSVSQVQGYIHSLMQIRGEFELQQRSLQAILQDQDKADDIWQKTVDLAVRSPFRVKELVTYTKQLAAYRVEADKLYDTNKMLADISAGLGVEMNRLILAFGQVRSASFLRGTELRQFTEAGIPLLEELAKYYEEIEGKEVKVGDVFERISKRMVSFADVEEIFKRLTSAGGTFYQMQEIQAETLQGQISNLRDSLDLMLNEIGLSMEGTIKRNVQRVRMLVENWQRIADVLKFVVAGFAAYKVNALLTDKALIKFAISQGYVTAGSSKLAKGLGLTRASFAKLFTTIKTGLATSGWLIAVTAILDVVMKTVQWHRDLKESIAEVNQRYYEQTTAFNKLISSYDKLQKAEKEEGANHEKIFKEKKKSLQELLTLAEKNYNIKTTINLDEISQEDIDAIVEQIEKDIIYAKDWGKEFGVFFAKGLSAGEGRFLGINFFGDNLNTDIEQLNDAIGGIGGATKNQLDAATTELEARYDELSNVAKSAYDELQKGKGDQETEQEWLERRIQLIYKAQEAEKFYGRAGFRNAKAIKDAEEAREKIAKRREEVEREISKVVEKQLREYGVEDFSNLSYEQQILVQYEIDDKFSELQISDELKRWAAAFAAEKFKIQYVVETPDPDDKKLLAWQEAYNAYISSFSSDTKKVIMTITDSETEREALAKQVRETKEIYDKIIKSYESGAKAYSKEEYEQAKKIAEEARRAQVWLEGTSGDKGKDLVAEKLKQRIRLIKEMNKEYEKLRKDMSKEEAEAEVRKAYAPTAKDLGLDISTMDFDDEGTIFSLKSLKKDAQYKAQKYAFEIQKELDGYEVELKVETKTEDRKKLKEKFDEMLDMVNLSKEMKELGIPESIADAFDVEYISLDAVKSNLKKAKNMFDALGEDGTKLYEDYLEKIDDMEDKAAKERMKTYVKYLQEGMSERVKLKIEELRKLKEVEDSAEFTSEQKERIKAGVSKEAQRELDKQEWEDFKGTEMYSMMFEDLEFLGTKALGVLQDKLEALKGSLSDLDASEVKEIIGQINKIEDVVIERNPFKYMKSLKEELKNMKGEEEYQIDLFNAQKMQEEAELYINTYDTIMSALASEEEGVFEEIDSETLATWTQMLRLAEQQGKSIEDIVKEKKADVVTSEGQAKVAAKGLNTYKRVRKTLQEQHDAWGEIGGKINEVFDASKELMTTLGADADGVAMSLVESGQAMGQLITSAVQFGLQMEIVGYQSNMALGVIGWILIAIQAIAKILSAIFSAKDKALQKQVEDNLAKVEALQEKYESLEESIDKAWDTASIKRYNQQLRATTQSMIESQKAAIEAQEQRKGANKEGTDAYNELQDMKKELDELQKQLDESLAESFSKVTDGILDSVHDAAREFTDAWWDAFVETGDGLKGLEENFNEMFLNLAKNQAAMQITGAFADKWKKDLEKYINEDDTELTKDDARKWAEEVRRTFPELSKALEGYLGVFKDMTTEMEGGSLSALQKGIQGVTEETAQVIEALLNSMRFYVADSNSELKSQTKILGDIYSLLNGLTDIMPAGRSGRGLKVVM